ncbi:MAG: DNA alkylation repair protein [Flavobacteriales bacterium]|nr:DNA alkylation repair protein [Flavobacteriales bacterium]
MDSFLQPIRDQFEAASNPARAEQMSAYMKGRFDYYGIMATPRGEMLKAFIKAHGLPTDTEAVIHYCWDQPEREWQYVGMELVYRMRKQWPDDMDELIEFMVLNKSWWDTVDFIASNITGHWYKTTSPHPDHVMEAWNEHSNFWLNRVTMIYQLKYKDQVNEGRLFRYLTPHLEVNEFFIRKAIGWALRQYSKTHPDRVRHYVETHELKPLSYKEATKYL